jgi:Cu/Ag efflux protein CusF
MKSHLCAAIMTAAVLTGCATSSSQQPPSGRMEDITEARATVTAIDRQEKLVTLKDESGKEFVADTSQAVANLDQVQVGDQVVISYSKALAWKVRPTGQTATAFSADATASTAKPGDKVTGSVGESVSMTATIKAIDPAAGTVTLDWGDGTSDTIKARDPANLKKVKVGDVVDILYSEALAVSLRPANK